MDKQESDEFLKTILACTTANCYSHLRGSSKCEECHEIGRELCSKVDDKVADRAMKNILVEEKELIE